MKNMFGIKFMIIVLCTILISFMIAVFIYPILMGIIKSHKILNIVKENKSDGNSHIIIIIYVITLGFFGLFNMYNSLEIYKKKEQIDKEFRDRLGEYKDTVNRNELDTKKAEMKFDYKEIEMNVKSLMFNLRDEINTLTKQIDENTKDQLIKVQENLNQMIIKLEEKQFNIEKDIKEIVIEFNSFSKTMMMEFNDHYYSYILQSLLPHYLGNEINRKSIIGAFYWFSQHGGLEDLEMLEERRKMIPGNESELIEICSNTIAEIKNRIVRKQN